MRSLQNRLLLLVGLALLPAVLLSVFDAYKDQQRALETGQANLQQVTRLAASNVAQSLDSARQLLDDLANDADTFGTPEICSARMRSAQKSNPEYSNLGLIQLNGDVLCSAVAVVDAVNVADRAHFKEAVTYRRFVVGGHVVGRVSRKHALVLVSPVLDRSGAVQTVLFASLDVLALDKFVAAIALPPGAILETVDRDGVTVSRRPDPDKWLGKPVESTLLAAYQDHNRPTRLLVGADGVERLYAFSDVGPPGANRMALSIAIPMAQITGPATREQSRTALILALTAAVALSVAWFAGQRLVVQPVEELIATARKIAAGNYVARTGAPRKKDELSRLARAIDHMAGSLAVQSAQRNKAREQAQRANRELVKTSLQKDEFLAMLAHELRNPLAPIRNSAYLLNQMPGADPRVVKCGQVITRQVGHISRLVDELLDVSRVTRGLVTIDAQPVDLNTVVDTAVEQTRPALDARQQNLSVVRHAGPAMADGDAARLVQVLANLIANASKFTPERGTIEVAVRSSSAAWEIGVADDGIGIDADLLPRVFDLFRQGERALDRAGGGLGLGLHLAKGLVEMHGGQISAHSPGEGLGSTFTVSLPLATGTVAAPATDAQPLPETAMQKKPISVLVVDDVADIADSVAMLLETTGYDFAVEYGGAAALQRAVTVSPQFCLLDIGMPEMDGYELVRRLRQLPQTQHAVMIAVTGYGQMEDKARALAAGFDHHLLKPVDPNVLGQLLAVERPAPRASHALPDSSTDRALSFQGAVETMTTMRKSA